MTDSIAVKLGRAFVDVLFVRPESENVRKLTAAGKVFVYSAAVLLFYLPILYFIVSKCIQNSDYIVYAAVIVAVHVLGKFMLHISRKIQRRFATIKSRKSFLLRTWLIIEYVAVMWLVYLCYPLSCILFPFSALAMVVESLFGYGMIFDFFANNFEQVIFIGGIVSYVLFILSAGYKKIRVGFLPDYLGLYAVLAIVSSALGSAAQWAVELLKIDMSGVAATLSWVFELSNNSMKIVASALTFCFAVRSLYKNCGTGDTDDSVNQEEPPEDEPPKLVSPSAEELY